MLAGKADKTELYDWLEKKASYDHIKEAKSVMNMLHKYIKYVPFVFLNLIQEIQYWL